MARYSRDGISFAYPEDWEVSDEEHDGELAVHVQSDSTAFWSLMVTPGKNDPGPILEAAAAALESEYDEVDRGELDGRSRLAGRPAVGQTIEFVVHELPALAEARVCWVDAETDDARTVFVLSQYADLESESVEMLLERMTDSLTIESAGDDVGGL